MYAVMQIVLCHAELDGDEDYFDETDEKLTQDG